MAQHARALDAEAFATAEPPGFLLTAAISNNGLCTVSKSFSPMAAIVRPIRTSGLSRGMGSSDFGGHRANLSQGVRVDVIKDLIRWSDRPELSQNG